MKLSSAPLHFQPWFLSLLAFYAVVELSFNHQLLDMAGDVHLRLNETQMHQMEMWGRGVSGMGLTLLLMRWLDERLRSRLWLMLVSAVVGFSTMWFVQKQLVDTIVSRADQEDLAMSLKAQLTTQEALLGRVLLRGEPLLQERVPPTLEPVVGALWASTVLGLSPDDIDNTSGAAQLMSHFVAPAFTGQQLRDIYRKTVMTPVALGASLFFGLLNVCQLMAGLVGLWMLRWQPAEQFKRWHGWLLPVAVGLCLVLSWWPENEWVVSTGYQTVARPALWQEKPFLAPFVEWSLRAEPAWSDPVAWVHRELLQNFQFVNAMAHSKPVRE